MKPRLRALPHPLLHPRSDDVTPDTFVFECDDGDITSLGDSWNIKGKIVHECPELETHVAAGRAALGIHVECPRTFYRGWFATGPEVSLTLSGQTVRGRVELVAMCVASGDIPDYHLAGQHEDYDQAKFQVGPGDLLAIVAHARVFDAYLDLDPIRKISSILDIGRCNDRDSGPASIDFNGDRILVELPPADHQRYKELRADPTMWGLLASNIVLPAVLQAISHLGRLSPDELEEAKAGRRWCRCLTARLEKNRVVPASSPEDIFRAVQEILREPIRHSLEDLLNQRPE